MSLKKALVILVGIAGLVYLIFSSIFTDVQINKYEDLEVVKEQKAIQSGRIPAILPESAFKIVETYDLDSNTVFGSFEYREKDEEKFLHNLTTFKDTNDTLVWENFLFKVDNKLNKVQFINKAN